MIKPYLSFVLLLHATKTSSNLDNCITDSHMFGHSLVFTFYSIRTPLYDIGGLIGRILSFLNTVFKHKKNCCAKRV